MKSLSLCAFCFATLSCAFSIPSLGRRQANSAIAASAFRRRAYHSSVVLDGWVYIDGGEFSYSSGSDITYQYSSSLLAIDLSQDWTNSSVNLHSSSKPSGAPNLVDGGIWVESDQKTLYTGFAGRQSTFGDGAYYNTGLWSFKPDGAGSGSWTNLNSSADPAFKTEPRPFSALVASSGGAGYMLGGFTVNASSSDPRYNAIPLTGMVSYNFTTNKLSNSTVSGVSTNGLQQMGGMHYIPNFGPEGVVIAFGGDQVGKDKPGSDSLLPMNTVQIFDPATGNWYEQTVTGNIPEQRKEFCTTGVASNNKTYEIFMYAGWDGNLGPHAVPFDEAFVLTLPGFHWVKADYAALNPRHGLSCNPIGGGQILTIGGLNTTQNGPDDLYKDVFNTADQFTQGLAVFDLNTMAWKTRYSAKQTGYTPSSTVQNFYDNNPRTPTFSSNGLQALMAVQNFSTAATATPSSSSSSSSSSSKSSSNAGAIAGGVVGGVVGLAALAGLVFFFLRRRKTSKPAAVSNGNAAEMPGREHQKHEMPADGAGVPGQQLHGGGNKKYVAVGQNEPPSELPASDERRHELA